jgi:hypothetical protein
LSSLVCYVFFSTKLEIRVLPGREGVRGEKVGEGGLGGEMT